jgi:hypothetical protein
MAIPILLWLISAYVYQAFLPTWADQPPLEPQSLSSLFKFSTGFVVLVDELCLLAGIGIRREVHVHMQAFFF